jgi:PEP-CTERM/exosortase A-associated glycosyltransferase
MKVLHVLNHSIPLHSGYTQRTLSLLREQRRLGWDTFHLTSPKHDVAQSDEETIEGWHFYRTRWQPRRHIPGLSDWALMKATERRLLQVASQLKPDLLHAHSPVLNALPALRVGRALGLPVVYEIRAFWEDAAVDQGTTTEGSLRYRLTRAMETHAVRRADHTFTICEGLRTDLQARGLRPEQVTVIPNAVDVEHFAPGGEADAALAAELGLSGKTVLGFIGTFFGYEGLDLLVEALPLLLQQRPDVHLLLVGSGEQEQALKAQVQRLGLQDKVLFTGRVPHSRVQAYYNLIDVLVYPRHPMRLTELVTPLKPLEAMAQGRVLLASDVGGHRELIEHDRTGLLFKAGDAQALASAAVKLLEARATWPELRTAGRRFVETERTWAASVARYRPVYDRLATRRG